MQTPVTESTTVAVQGLLLEVGIDPEDVNQQKFRALTDLLSGMRPTVQIEDFPRILTEDPILARRWSALKMSAKIA